jgi:nitrate/nitrite transporter NarK
MFIAPALMAHYGWQFVPKFYAVALLITAVAFWFFFGTRHIGPRQERCLIAAAVGGF